MSQLNPFIGSILQTPQAQRLQSELRDDRVRRTQQARRNAAAGAEPDAIPVENADELDPSGDALHRQRGTSRPAPDDQPRHDDEPGEHVDIRA
jgi:hypothetical protein